MLCYVVIVTMIQCNQFQFGKNAQIGQQTARYCAWTRRFLSP